MVSGSFAISANVRADRRSCLITKINYQLTELQQWRLAAVSLC